MYTIHVPVTHMHMDTEEVETPEEAAEPAPEVEEGTV